MSLSTVMKNVYTFAQILGQASGKTAGLWDLQALQNALKWADYCEKIQQHVKDRSIERALDKKLLDMTIMLDPPSCVCLSVDVLGNSVELLKKMLFENPHTSMEVLSHLVAERKRRETEVMQHFSEMISQNCVIDLPAEVLSFLEDDTELRNIENLRRLKQLGQAVKESPVVLAQAGVVLHHFIKLAQLYTSDKVISHIEHILERTSCLKHGWEIIVCMVYLNLTDICGSTKDIKAIITQWLDKKQDAYINLLDVPPIMLSKATTSDEEFCKLYLHVLTWLANQMTAEYHQPINGKLYSWSYKTGNSCVVLGDIVDGFQLLMDCGGDKRRMTVSLLMEKAQLSYFNIWRDVCRKLH